MFRPFGGSTSTFGSGSIPPSPQQPSTSGTSSFFGGGPTLAPFSSPHVPFQPQKDHENGVSFTINSISAMPNYIGKSFEEIRLEDYALGRKGRTSAFPTSQPQGMSSAFLNTPTTNPNPFGTQPSTSANSFLGMSNTGMGFGQQPLGGGLGGSSIFGLPQQQQQQQQPTSSMFNAQQPAASTGGSFGAPQPFNPISFGSGIGQQSTSTPSSNTGGFGSFGFGNPGAGLGGGTSMFNNPPSSSGNSGSLFQPNQSQQAPSFAQSFPPTNTSAPTNTSFTGGSLFQPPQQQQQAQATTSSGFGFQPPSTVTQQNSLFPGLKPPSATSGLFNPQATPAPGSSTGLSLFPSMGTAGTSTTTPNTGGFDLFKPSQPTTSQPPSNLGFAGSSSLFPGKPSLFSTSAPSTAPGGLFNPSTPSLIGGQQQPGSLLFKQPSLGAPTTSLPVIAPPPEILSIAPPLHPSLKSISSSVKPAEPRPSPMYNPLPSAHSLTTAPAQPNSGEVANIVPKIVGNLVPLGSKKTGNNKSDVKKLVITVSMQDEEVDEENSTSAPSRIGDYYMEPSEAALRKLSPSQLSAVSDFVIGQTGVGEIRFLKPVDLTSVDLDRIFSHIVRFEPKQVVMYPEEDKPAVGEGLNQPALIKLERCWPTQRGSRTLITDPDNERMRQHIDRLKNVPDTKFVSFEPATGVWQFKVEHF